jgi:endonuclease G
MRATFLLSNVIPQVQSVNAGKWAQVERAVRALASDFEAVYVFTGVLFEAPEVERIGLGRVAVPTHTYQVALAVRGSEKLMYAVIMPNDPSAVRQITTVREVERRAGLDFFSALEDTEEQHLKSGHLP